MTSRKIASLSILVGTAACNADCPECAGRQHRPDAPLYDGEIDEQRLRTSLQECRDAGCRYVTLTGCGEPTLSPLAVTRTLEIIDVIGIGGGWRFAPVNLYTNGICLGENDDFARLWLRRWQTLGLTSVYVSAYSADETLNAQAFGVNSYPNFSDIFRRITRTGLRARVSVILKQGFTDTAAKFETLCRKFFALGVTNISAWPVKDEEDHISSLAPSPEELSHLRAHLDSIMPELWQTYPGCSVRLLFGNASDVTAVGQKVALFQTGELSNAWCKKN